MSKARITGQFVSHITDVPCQLHLELDKAGCIAGTFCADAEELHILGNHPKDSGEFFGAVRSIEGDTVALFHAMPEKNGLMLEFEAPPTETNISSFAEVVHFAQVKG